MQDFDPDVNYFPAFDDQKTATSSGWLEESRFISVSNKELSTNPFLRDQIMRAIYRQPPVSASNKRRLIVSEKEKRVPIHLKIQ